MNFKKDKFTTTLKYNQTIIPQVVISELALAQMFTYTKEAPGQDEIGWLGTVYREGNTFHIKETFLFKQEVHGTTTEITPEGLAEFATELLSQPGGAEKWNDIKVWGHSHVNMATNPSAQDDKQMDEFAGVGHEYFLRLICNKKGDLRIDVYLYEEGLSFFDVPWKAEKSSNQNVESFQEQIKTLEEQIEALKGMIESEQNALVASITEPIKEEIKQKVKKLVYHTQKTVNNQTTWGFYNKEDYSPVYLDDYFSVKELEMLYKTVHTRADFVGALQAKGLYKSLSFNDVTDLWQELQLLRYGGK